MTEQPPGSRWQRRIEVAEAAVRGDRQARAALHDEVRRLTEDEYVLDGPEAAGSMSYFVAVLRELGDEARADHAHATGVISDWVRNAPVSARHACVTHNRLATVLAENGNGQAAREALGKALEAARTPVEEAYTLAQRGVVEARFEEWRRARQYAGRAEHLVPPGDSGGAWLDVRMGVAFVLFRVEQMSDSRDGQRMLVLAQRLVEVCDRQIDRWGDDHPRALEALVMMASAQHAAAEVRGDVDTMARTTGVLEAAAQRSSTLLGARHPQSASARGAVREADRITRSTLSRSLTVDSTDTRPKPRRPARPRAVLPRFEQVRRSMPDVPLALGPDDEPEFLYEKGVVLARDGEEARLVEDAVRAYFTAAAVTGLTADHVRRAGPETNRSGITRIRVGDPGLGDHRGDVAVTHALRAVREHEGRAGRRLVSRNHVVSIAPIDPQPGGEPIPAPLSEGPNPAVADSAYDADTAVDVLVVDTGLVHDHRSVPLLAHTRGDSRIGEADDRGVLQQYAGHGTFMAGLVAAVAPNTDITVVRSLNDAGAVLESDFGERLFDAVDEHGWPEVIVLSAGTSNGRTDGLLGVEAFMRELRGRRTLLVAAAGDNAGATPFWPAAYASLPDYEEAVLSVGALRGDGEYGACFSNHGSWVSAYAPGEHLVSALTGFDEPVPYVYQHSTRAACRFGFTYQCGCQHPRRTGALSENGTTASAEPDQVMFDGFARWSGTAFAAPVAAGMVAARLTATKERDARAARRQLLASNTAYAEVRGAPVAALLPATWRPSPIVHGVRFSE